MTFPKLEQLVIYYKLTTYEKPLKKPRGRKNLGPADGKQSKSLRLLIKYADPEIFILCC